MASAEFAVALPVVVVLVAGLLGALAVAVDQLRCVDAAAAVARSAARGDPWSVSTDLARRVGPPDASVRVSTSDQEVTVTVSVDRGLGQGRWPGPITVSASATAAREVIR